MAEKELKCHFCKASLEDPNKYFHLARATCGDVENMPTPICGRCIGVIRDIIRDWWNYCPANKNSTSYNDWRDYEREPIGTKKGDGEVLEVKAPPTSIIEAYNKKKHEHQKKILREAENRSGRS